MKNDIYYNAFLNLSNFNQIYSIEILKREDIEKIVEAKFKRLRNEKEIKNMDDLERKNAEILDHYGWELQKNKLYEELSELIVAIAKNRPWVEVLPEVADCYNMLQQTCLHYGFTKDMVENNMKGKCERTLKRIYEDTEM